MNRFFSNDLDAFVPELWSKESLAILEENMVAGNLVYREFSNTLANFGDTVNTRRPAEFEAKRKVVTDDVTIQDATATNVPVKLNQHIHTSFMLRDGEESLSFMDLVAVYLRPAMLAQARMIDQIVLGQFAQFLMNIAGSLDALSSSNAKDYILDTRQVLNENKAYVNGRNMVVNPSSETEMLKVDLFVSAEKVGDQGTALRQASLGQKLGFDIFMCQNMSSIATGNTKKTGAINNAGGYAAGVATLVVDGFTGTLTPGAFLTIAGDMTPLRIASTTATLGNATGIVLSTTSPFNGLRRAVTDDAVINVYTPGAVNNASGYAVGYSKAITVDGFSVAPRVGQLVAFGTAAALYTIVGTPTTTSILLDRPLDAAISDDDAVCIGPPGDYNFAFHRDAIALVIRPLAMPRVSAIAGSATYKNLSMRTVITYEGRGQGHLVTLDMLAGIKVLDTDLGAVLLG